MENDVKQTEKSGDNTMTDHSEFYNTFCRPQFEGMRKEQKEEFEKVHRKLDDVCNLLKGRDGGAGVIDNVRANTKFRKRVGWLSTTAIAALIAQAGAYIKQKLSG